MTECLYVVGDTRDVTAKLPDGSVDLVLTSPPFLALRSYLPADHPDKDREIGSEATPAEFLQVLLELTAEWGRVLAPHGSICVELGDTYSGAGGYGSPDSPNPAYGAPRFEERFTGRTAKRFKTKDDGWPEAKSLCGIPHLYHLSLAYGRNLLTGEPSPAGQWRVRNVVAWCRPNPPVGALGDKFRPATSYLTIATRARDRWFDLDAVRTASDYDRPNLRGKGSRPGGTPEGQRPNASDHTTNPAGAPPLDWWNIPTAPYTGSHYAVFPPALLERPIKAMCPIRVCTVCGQPARRIVGALRTLDAYRQSGRPQTIRAVQLADEAGLTDEHISAVRAFGTSDAGKATILNDGSGRNSAEVKVLAAEAKAVLGGYFREFVMSTNATPTSVWTDCGHDTWRPGRVLDPFGGSGTTGLVATGHGRDCLLIDLDPRNLDLAVDRVGPLMLRGASVDEAAAWLGTNTETLA